MEIILKGILSGMVLAVLIGPVFFSIIQTSIERGFISGVWVALGVSLSDAAYILFSYLGLTQFFDNSQNKLYLAYIGGGILLSFGFYYLFIKSRRMMNFTLEHVKERSPLRLFAKGFIINGLSPMVLLFWLGTVSLATTDMGYETHAQVALFFCSIVITVFATDILKAKLAEKLRALLTARFIKLLNIFLGIVFVGFGVRLLLFADKALLP